MGYEEDVMDSYREITRFIECTVNLYPCNKLLDH